MRLVLFLPSSCMRRRREREGEQEEEDEEEEEEVIINKVRIILPRQLSATVSADASSRVSYYSSQEDSVGNFLIR